MKYVEEKTDLFNYEGKAWLAHCISADFALGMGIADEFNKRYTLKSYLNKNHVRGSWSSRGYCIKAEYCKVFNLVTKEKFNKKPTYRTLLQAIENMKNLALLCNVDTIAMPMIGCGLDKLNWEKVRDIIKTVFDRTDITIIVCKL